MNLRCDLTDLRLFANIVDTGSITAGAEATHMALASASARIQGLEESLDTPLLLRSRRGVQATEAGLLLLQHAREVLKATDALRDDVERHARTQRGLIRLVGNSAALREYVVDALGDFLAQYPDINVQLDETLAKDAVDAVHAGAADVAVVTELTELRGLQARTFRRIGFAVVTPPGHAFALAAARGAASMDEASLHDVVGLAEGNPLQDSWEDRAVQRGARLNHRVRVHSFDAQVRLIARGVGLALMPEAAASRLAQASSVEVFPMAEAHLNRQLLLCTRPGAPPSPGVQALLDCICAGAS